MSDMMYETEIIHRPEPIPLEPARIVVIEDDPDYLRLLMSTLRRAGFQVKGLRDGYEAVEYIAGGTLGPKKRPDLILSDVKLPGYDGLQLLQAIRQAHWALPVILMSGFATSDAEQAGKRYGAAAVLSKPFELPQLTALVERLLGNDAYNGNLREPARKSKTSRRSGAN